MPQQTIQILPATIEDVPDILLFVRALAEYEHLTHACAATEADLRKHLFNQHPAAEVLIARLENKPIGFALFFRSFSTFVGKPGIFLEDLFVLPDARGHGVGKALLKAVAKIAVDRHCGRLEWAVLDWNAPSIGFYKKLGAVPMDDWTTFRVTGQTLNDLAGN
jgi:GNAT superfamily N-acetyltransferase